jgi:hypothetical protein
MTVAAGRLSLDAGALLAQQQGDGLELRAHGRRDTAALGGRLDLTDGSSEHHDDVATMADPSLVSRGGPASARLALAWSCHRLLLWNAGLGDRGSMLHSPAGGAHRAPGRGPGPPNAQPTWGSPTIDAAGLSSSQGDPKPPGLGW